MLEPPEPQTAAVVTVLVSGLFRGTAYQSFRTFDPVGYEYWLARGDSLVWQS